MFDKPPITADDPRDHAIGLLETRVAELETELEYWRQVAKLKEATP
jgi:hypothetical protein